MFKRVAVTYDLLRITSQNEMRIRMADSLFQLLRYPIFYGTGVSPEFIGEQELPTLFADVYGCPQGKEKSADSWVDIYHAESNDALYKIFRETFSSCLVVGFELPPIYKNTLTHCGINYIDTVIHPIRYLSDIFYGFSSNNPAIEHFLQTKSIPPRLFFHAAAQQKARYANNVIYTPLEDNILFVVGQTPRDKALVSPQRSYYSLLDYTDRLDDLMKTHSRMVFKPHPWGCADTILAYFAQRKDCIVLPSSEFPELNTYIYLSHPSITTFAGLNSSLLLESTFFGKKAYNFAPFEYNFDHEHPSDTPGLTSWPIFDDCFTESFWYELFSVQSPSAYIPPPPLPFAPKPNLRLSLRGIGSFDDAQSYTQCCKIGALESDMRDIKKHVGLETPPAL